MCVITELEVRGAAQTGVGLARPESLCQKAARLGPGEC